MKKAKLKSKYQKLSNYIKFTCVNPRNPWPREVRQVSNVFDKSTFLCKTKPNSPSVQMNLTSAKTRDYDNFRPCDRVKNKAKQSQISHQKSEYRRQNTEDKNVYKYLPNKELRLANSLDVSQDVIKNQHKNKAKTNPIQSQS